MRNGELIARVQTAQPGAFDQLYFAYVDKVHRQLFSVVGPDADLDDLIQQTFVQIHKKIGGFRGDCAFSTWLHRLTLNVALMHLRGRQRRRRWVHEKDAVLPALEPARRPHPDEEASEHESLRQLHQLIGELKPKKRLVFVLYHLEGHTIEEIAILTTSSPNTVASRLRAARKELRRGLTRFEQLLGQAAKQASSLASLMGSVAA